MWKVVFIVLSVAFGLARVGLTLFDVELGEHGQRSFEAFAHMWVGGLLMGWWVLHLVASIISRIFGGEETVDLEIVPLYKWFYIPFWTLAAVELFSALVLLRLL
jgi:hypothetical protein